MDPVLVGLIVGNVSAVVALWLRLRWRTAQQKEHRMQMVELVLALPENSYAESQDGPTGFCTRVTVGRSHERT
ncbi:hypothetical protein ACFWPX_36445 [Nocardia sp. NPDC058518]|uniref:hypothetical protein n=1 Tax=Nocardia sp. NPDC058518 TaxID=3346534 RepID=UPI00365A641B